MGRGPKSRRVTGRIARLDEAEPAPAEAPPEPARPPAAAPPVAGPPAPPIDLDGSRERLEARQARWIGLRRRWLAVRRPEPSGSSAEPETVRSGDPPLP